MYITRPSSVSFSLRAALPSPGNYAGLCYFNISKTPKQQHWKKSVSDSAKKKKGFPSTSKVRKEITPMPFLRKRVPKSK